MRFDCLVDGSVGPLKKGMTRLQVRALMGEGFVEFRKTPSALNTCDAFKSCDLHVYYNELDVVKGVEFFGRSNLLWEGRPLVGEEALKLSREFESKGLKIFFDSYGFYVDELGFSFSVPEIDDDVRAVVESVYVSFL